MPKIVDFMVDIETLATGYRAMVVSIGAVAFDLETGTLGQTFYERISMRDAQRAGFVMDADTVGWWMDLQPEALAQLRVCPREVRHVFGALSQFLTHDRGGPIKPRVWGNGSNFDNRILREGYDLLGIRCPWHFRDDRDMRTYSDILQRLGCPVWKYGGPEVPPPPVRHDALDDAKYQARVLIEMWKVLRGSYPQG